MMVPFLLHYSIPRFCRNRPVFLFPKPVGLSVCRFHGELHGVSLLCFPFFCQVSASFLVQFGLGKLPAQALQSTLVLRVAHPISLIKTDRPTVFGESGSPGFFANRQTDRFWEQEICRFANLRRSISPPDERLCSFGRILPSLILLD